MHNFREFFLAEVNKSDQDDIINTLKSLPKEHQKLLKGYSFSFQDGHELKNDPDHVGSNNLHSKKIKVASPWLYAKEFAFLHEIAHKIWNHLVLPNEKLVNQWKTITKQTKNKVNQNAEELFCHAYAAAYSQRPPVIYSHPTWIKFVKSI